MFTIDIKSKSFSRPNHSENLVLKNILFKIEDQDFLSIIGPSGCGKTTLLRILAGFDQKFDGKILYLSNSSESSEYNQYSLNPNKSTQKNSLENRQRQYKSLNSLGKVGYIPQEFSLFPWLTIEQNIRFGLNIKNIPKKEQDVVVSRLLDLVGMREYKDYLPKEISGGMQQKIAICRAIAINPTSNLIVMDEPFSALDSQTRNALQRDLLDIWKKQNLTIVFVTHNIDEATFLSKRVIVLSSNPASITREVRIDLAHPRDRTSLAFNNIRKELLSYVQKE
ncbi:MAG: ABC transporter ATP-binding protein [Candidatus Lokiarchaeota archaeon]|nr:ABC transporter ATP-binding protein [Candidatus Harpocratesius repetitus]